MNGADEKTLRVGSDTVSMLRERSSRRKQLLVQSLGVDSPQDLTSMLGSYKEKKGKIAGFQQPSSSKSNDSVFIVAKIQSASDSGDNESRKRKRIDSDSSSDGEKVLIDDYYKVLKEEEKVFKGSATFLKGTQSANPHNDYSQNFVDSGMRPQNFIRDPGLNERFDEFPKLRELIELKDDIARKTATQPMYLQVDLHSFRLRDLHCRFDVILLDPPLIENRQPGQSSPSWTWDMIETLDIASVAANRCFIWVGCKARKLSRTLHSNLVWCGSSPEGTTRARACLRRWGFRRCEDICWVKRNSRMPSAGAEPEALFRRAKEHCLMGIRGTVRRSSDGDFIHANVDIDLIITEEPIDGDLRTKPEESFLIPEHFCLGRRRLHLFGRDDTLRPGWVTVGPELASSNYDHRVYTSLMEQPPGPTTGTIDRIEQLRPKSPERGMVHKQKPSSISRIVNDESVVSSQYKTRNAVDRTRKPYSKSLHNAKTTKLALSTKSTSRTSTTKSRSTSTSNHGKIVNNKTCLKLLKEARSRKSGVIDQTRPRDRPKSRKHQPKSRGYR